MNLTGFYHPIEAASCLSWFAKVAIQIAWKMALSCVQVNPLSLSTTSFPLLGILLVSGTTLQDGPKEEKSCLRHLSKTGARLLLAEEFFNSFIFISFLFMPRVLLYKLLQCAGIVTTIVGWSWYTRSYPVVNLFVSWEI